MQSVWNASRRVCSASGWQPDSFGACCGICSGTIPEKQRRQIQNAANDMEVRLVPKLTPRKISLVLEEGIAKELVNAAQARCKYECVPDLDGDRNCELCKLLEAVVPLEKYESTTCPYWRAEWEDD